MPHSLPLLPKQFFQAAYLTGQSAPSLTVIDQQSLENNTAAAFAVLQHAAAQQGIALKIASGYRSFARQAQIWQAKYQGLRPVFNAQGEKIDLSTLQGFEKLQAILLYSALPGASRHHWGTDFDVYDSAAVPSDYCLQLTPDEYGPHGPFAKLNHWLEQHGADYGFFRPYAEYRGGVAVEPWHLSYQPLARQCLAHFTAAQLAAAITASELPDKTLILTHIEAIFQQYVLNICDDDRSQL